MESAAAGPARFAVNPLRTRRGVPAALLTNFSDALNISRSNSPPFLLVTQYGSAMTLVVHEPGYQTVGSNS